jgi:hypothetical protein
MSSSNSLSTEADLSLDSYLHRRWPDQVADVRRLLDPLLEALSALHGEGRIHGGIEPAALRFSPDGILNRDHFLAHARREGENNKEVPHAFRAPETFGEGAPDARVDCYAVGALLHKVMTGSEPAPASRRPPQAALLTPAQHPRWPVALLDLTNRCLALTKEERFNDARSLRAELDRVSQDPGGSTAPPAVQGVSKGPLASAEVEVPKAEPPTSAENPPSGATPAPQAPDPAVEALPEAPPATVESAQASVCLSDDPVPFSPPLSPQSASPAAPLTPQPIAPPPPTVGISPQNIVAPPAASLGKLNVAERLPNASVGKPYQQKVRDLFGDQADRVCVLKLKIPDGCGLTYDQATETLEGSPRVAGEFPLELTFRLVAPGSGPKELTRPIGLTINADPSSLWKDIPPDPNGPFSKPDYAKASCPTPQLTVLAASLRGRSHAHEGKYRDDDFGLHWIEESGWHLLIVADGAGSAKFSRRGSELACKVAVMQLAQELAPGNKLDKALKKFAAAPGEAEVREQVRLLASNFFSAAAYAALAEIHKQAEQVKQAEQGNARSRDWLRDFATTFIAVIVKRLEAGWFFASFAIGDGGAGVVIRPDKVEVLTQPDGGDFAGQTLFLTMPRLFEGSQALSARTRVAFCEDFRFLAVMTDGVSDPIFESDAAFTSAAAWHGWEKQLAQNGVNVEAPQPNAGGALLEYLKFSSPGHHDDRTLILAVPTRTGSPA